MYIKSVKFKVFYLHYSTVNIWKNIMYEGKDCILKEKQFTTEKRILFVIYILFFSSSIQSNLKKFRLSKFLDNLLLLPDFHVFNLQILEQGYFGK